MRIHELKIKNKYFEPVISGEKSFELRKNDRNFEVGDILYLREITDGPNVQYTGRETMVYVSYILPLDGMICSSVINSDYVIMAIAPVDISRDDYENTTPTVFNREGYKNV